MSFKASIQWISRLLALQPIWIVMKNPLSPWAAFALVGYSNAFSQRPPMGTASYNRSRRVSPLLVSDTNVHTIDNPIIDPTENEPTSISKNGLELTIDIFDKIVNARYACTRFQRYKEPPFVNTTEPTASLSNPQVIQAAVQGLSLAQRAPTGFNVQPYRIVLVHDYEQKMVLSQYCLGRNADRIRDSDCTAIFLSDEQVGRDWGRFKKFLMGNMDEDGSSNHDAGAAKSYRSKTRARRSLTNDAMNKMRILILLFSSGYPFPYFVSRPFSFFLRLGVTIIGSFTRWLHGLKQKLSSRHSTISKYLCKLLPRNSLILPTLSSSETWSQKNTMLAAMTYILACTSRGLSTCPMEGFDAQGIRNVLGIPRRFGIPLIVSAGMPYGGADEGVDDVGVSHGDGGMSSPRYPREEVVFGNVFGESLVTG